MNLPATIATSKIPFWLLSLGFVIVAATAVFIVIRKNQSLGSFPENQIRDMQKPFDVTIRAITGGIIYDDAMQPVFRSRPYQILGRLYETIIKADNTHLHRFLGAEGKYYYVDGSTTKLLAA